MNHPYAYLRDDRKINFKMVSTFYKWGPRTRLAWIWKPKHSSSDSLKQTALIVLSSLNSLALNQPPLVYGHWTVIRYSKTVQSLMDRWITVRDVTATDTVCPPGCSTQEWTGLFWTESFLHHWPHLKSPTETPQKPKETVWWNRNVVFLH